MIIQGVLNNWIEVTHGPFGIADIPRPVIFRWTVESSSEFVLIGLGLVLMTLWVVSQIVESPYGRVLRAIREDEQLAAALGKCTQRYKTTSFVVGACLAAAAGCLFAHYMTYIDPTSFTVMESVLILCVVIVGGTGRNWGPVVGAVVLVCLPEAITFLGFPSAIAANLRQILYGSALIVCMIWRPQGIAGGAPIYRVEKSSNDAS